jgi:1,4-alpha-glucan branching enzyme
MNTFASLARGECGDPFSVLGIHPHPDGGWVVRAFLPWALEIKLRVGRRRPRMARASTPGGWEVRIPPEWGYEDAPPAYRMVVMDAEGTEWVREDPYRFPPSLDESRVRDFLEGRERRAHLFMGAHPWREGRVEGTRFAVWAPHARAVGLAGDMNGWDPRIHPMRPRGSTGLWELFVPGVTPGAAYKYQVVTSSGDRVEKADPFGRAAEVRPSNASVVAPEPDYPWKDDEWMGQRTRAQSGEAPMSVYEVHLGSWRKHGDHTWLGYRDLADQLIPYVKEMGFTHIELLPVTEHPLDQSWGYQPVGFFASTARFGSPDDLRYLVDRAHREGIGVLLDWVPGHFARDTHGLGQFDGSALFEPDDPRMAEHPDWGTLTFDYGKPAVRSFLISSALHWLEDFHFDGIRVDAVASMLYLDYSRKPGEWTPNREGGNTNLDAVDFLRGLNDAIHHEVPGAITVAEESTAWQGVSHPTGEGGLGFDQKWNMGWMNDTLEFFREDPVHRKHHYDKITFSMVYAFSERFVLPLSHDEVVHGKGSLLAKMPGHDPEKFANLRLLLAHQWTHPGKKLLFMGGELGQWVEWNEGGQVDWALEQFPAHTGVRTLVRDLNRLYSERPSLHATDFSPGGFEWLNAQDPDTTTLAYLRWAPGWRDPLVVALNLTPVCREEYRIPVPFPGRYRVVLNSDAGAYGGWGTLVDPELESHPEPLLGREHSVVLRLPGLAAVVLDYLGD